MKLKINPPTQAKPFARQIDFEQNQLVLHANTDIVLPYQDICLNFIFHLGVSSAPIHRNPRQWGDLNDIDWLQKSSYLQYVTLEFITSNFTYQIAHRCTLDDIFSFLDYKFPFAKFTYCFQHENDILTQELAKNISVAFNDHLQYGLHDNVFYPRSRQVGTPHGVPCDIVLQERKTGPFGSSLLLILFLLAPLAFIGFVLGYLLPLWDSHDGVHWFFAIFCGLLLALYVFFVFKVYHARQLRKKITKLKQAKQEKPNY